MRKVQVSIKVDIFSDASAEGFEGWEPLRIYTDANNVYEAIAGAIFELLSVLQENGRKLPAFGDRSHISSKKMKAQKKWLECSPQNNKSTSAESEEK